MDWTAHNSGFVIAAYALSAACIIGLCLYVIHRDRQLAENVKDKS